MKQTEIGLIPDDWEVKKLSEIGTFCKGSGISREESNTGEFPAIRYGELYTIHNDYIKSFKSHISNEVASKSKRLKQGDLLFTCSGETKEAIGKCVAFIGSERAYAGGDLLILSPTINIDSLFYGFLLNTNIAIKQKSAMAQGDAIVHISTESIGKVLVPFPPLPEQQRIAKALSDVDALIFTTEKLLQKKRNIKQGTMQNLLTGKKRLPGFAKSTNYKQSELGPIPEDWKVKSLGEICVINPASSNIIPDEFFYVDLESVSSGKLGKKQKIRRRNAPSRAQRQFEKNDILYQTVRPYQRNNLFVNFDSKNYIASTGYAIIRSNNNVDSHYIYQIIHLNNFVNIILDNCTGTSYPAINPKFLKTIPVIIPKKEEQAAIANVLSSMDKEIETLNTKLEKYRNLKNAMMQQLLTGKIRLV